MCNKSEIILGCAEKKIKYPLYLNTKARKTVKNNKEYQLPCAILVANSCEGRFYAFYVKNVQTLTYNLSWKMWNFIHRLCTGQDLCL